LTKPAEAHGDLAALFGDWNDVALRLAFETKAGPRVMQEHLLLSIQPASINILIFRPQRRRRTGTDMIWVSSSIALAFTAPR
jgi:hypothetical protein